MKKNSQKIFITKKSKRNANNEDLFLNLRKYGNIISNFFMMSHDGTPQPVLTLKQYRQL